MLKEWDMVEICHQNFYEFFAEHRHIPEDAHLLYDKDTVSTVHYVTIMTSDHMSSVEWEAIGLYLVFVLVLQFSKYNEIRLYNICILSSQF